ncbi:polyprenyl synthetase family protein [Thermosulfuriphilus sp.]
MNKSGLVQYLSSTRALVDEALDRYLPQPSGGAAKVVEAMRYSVFAGGKRLRPILLLAAAATQDDDQRPYLPAACALECIHTYSLIHDDLPAMDDDDLRRGRPTCHKVFGEALAILAGDGLLTLAFELLSSPDLIQRAGAERVLETISLIAQAAGVSGMVGGQTADILAEGREISAKDLEFIHLHKTAALIKASVVSGGLLAGADSDGLRALEIYGEKIGLAFQIVDDVLDIVGDEKLLGKPIGSDLRRQKNTYPQLFGLEAAKAKARELISEAEEALLSFGPRGDVLRAIARYIVERNM